MRLREFNDAIATVCNVRSNIVTAVQTETFRQIRAAIEKGDKIIVPDFGIFLMREVPGEDGQPPKKVVRFRPKTGEEKAGKKDKAARKQEKSAAQSKPGEAAPQSEPSDDED